MAKSDVPNQKPVINETDYSCGIGLCPNRPKHLPSNRATEPPFKAVGRGAELEFELPGIAGHRTATRQAVNGGVSLHPVSGLP